MRKSTFLACIFLSIINAAKADEELANLVKKIKPAVVLIQTYDANGQSIGQGSGFFINKGRIVTSHHVIEGAFSATVKTISEKEYSVKDVATKENFGENDEIIGFLVQSVVAWDIEADIVKLDVNIPDISIVLLKLSKVVPSEGEDVIVIGSPLGLEASVSTGIVSAVRDIPNFGKIIQITAAISPGSSGSPVLNKKGEVVGIATFAFTEGQNLNFAISSEKILALKDSVKPTPLKEYNIGRTDPNEDQKLYYLGLKEVFQENWEMALSYFQKAVAKNPKLAEAYFFMGNCYDKLERYLDAKESYKQAIRIKPDLAEAHYNLGVTYDNLGRYTEAIESYKQALRIEPDYDDAHCNLGVAYSNLDRYTEAIESFKQAIRINPDFAGAHYNLGVTYVKLDRNTEAIESFKQAIRINPDFAGAHYNLGLSYLIVGNRSSALEEYKVLKTLDIDLAIKLFNLIYK